MMQRAKTSDRLGLRGTFGPGEIDYAIPIELYGETCKPT